eukprot:509623-Rhodomonas_salina.2
MSGTDGTMLLPGGPHARSASIYAGTAPTAAFYEACDAYGVLVWVEFWITGDDNGRGSGDSQYPLDHRLFLECAEDVIRLYCHPPCAPSRTRASERSTLRRRQRATAVPGAKSKAKCLGPGTLCTEKGFDSAGPDVGLVLTGRVGCCQDLSEGLIALIQRLDPARTYVRGSLWDGFADGHGVQEPAMCLRTRYAMSGTDLRYTATRETATCTSMTGTSLRARYGMSGTDSGFFCRRPYHPVNPSDFYQDRFYAYGFNPEVGSVGLPVAESVHTMLPAPLASAPPLFRTDAASGHSRSARVHSRSARVHLVAAARVHVIITTCEPVLRYRHTHPALRNPELETTLA